MVSDYSRKYKFATLIKSKYMSCGQSLEIGILGLCMAYNGYPLRDSIIALSYTVIRVLG